MTVQLMTREQMEVYKCGVEFGWRTAIKMLDDRLGMNIHLFLNETPDQIIERGQGVKNPSPPQQGVKVENPNEQQRVRREESPELRERPAYLDYL